jgi:hypothetical protein
MIKTKKQIQELLLLTPLPLRSGTTWISMS